MTSTIEASGPNSGTAALDGKLGVVDELVVLSPALPVVLSDGNPMSADGSVGVMPISVELSLGIPMSVELSDDIPGLVELSPARGSLKFDPGSGVCAYADWNNDDAKPLPMTAKLATVRTRIDIRIADAPTVILLTC